MLNTIPEVLAWWNYETEVTKKLYNSLTDDVFDKPQIEGVNTIGAIAWHILKGHIRLLKRMGLHLQGTEEPTVNLSFDELRKQYNRIVEIAVDEMQKVWTDADLSRKVTIFGSMVVPIDTALMLLMRHETHHRGQIGILLRVIGKEAPGVSGPAKQEWEKFGIPEPQF